MLNFRSVTANTVTNSQDAFVQQSDPFLAYKGLAYLHPTMNGTLPIGNTCQSELSNLMRCMRDHDYDTSCRGILSPFSIYNPYIFRIGFQQEYLSCSKLAVKAYQLELYRVLTNSKK